MMHTWPAGSHHTYLAGHGDSSCRALAAPMHCACLGQGLAGCGTVSQALLVPALQVQHARCFCVEQSRRVLSRGCAGLPLPAVPQNENPDHPESKIVTLRGSEENVARAKECIKQLLEEALAPQEGEVEEKISCPAGIVGRIIGRGGETIRCAGVQAAWAGWCPMRRHHTGFSAAVVQQLSRRVWLLGLLV